MVDYSSLPLRLCLDLRMRLHTAFSLTFLSIALLFNLTACGSTTGATGKKEESKVAQPRVIENISYVDNDTSAAHTLDLYFPPGEHSKAPLLVWIHGGAWKEGDKQPSPMMPLLVRGFAVAGINYRFAPDHKFPAQIYDCKAAIRWLRKHADEYGFDKNRIGVFGISAGGHLAALMGATNGVKELEGNIGVTGESSDVQAVVAWCGVGNLSTLHAQAGQDDQLDYDSDQAPVSMFLGGTAQKKPEIAKAASPVTYLKPGLKVPCLIMHAVKDPVVPFAQSQELYEAWKKTGAPVTLESVKSDQHIFISVPTMITVIDFFQKTLAEKGGADVKLSGAATAAGKDKNSSKAGAKEAEAGSSAGTAEGRMGGKQQDK